MAIKRAERALVWGQRAQHDKAITVTTNSVAYQLASRARAEDLGKALELMQIVRDNAGDDYHSWETVAWVLMRFAPLRPEQRTQAEAEATAIVRRLLQREDIDSQDPSWREKIRDKYRKCFGMSL